MVVLDTSALSAVMHGLPEALRHLRGLAPGDVLLTSPVAAEVAFGLERLPDSRRRRLLSEEYRRIRQAVRWHDWAEPAALEFGRQKARLERMGAPIDDMDLAIGSIAASLGASVATLNLKHFSRLEAIEVEDWGA